MDLTHLIAQASEIARSTTLKEAPIADKEGRWVSASMAALQEAGLTGLVVPAECGGLGQGLYALARVCEELGQAYSSAGLCFGMHCVGAAVIAAKATPWQKQAYLEPIAAGAHLTTLALSEPGTGAHFYFPQTTLTALSGDALLINGGKTFVTNGSHAHSYVVSTMAASQEATPDQFSCVVLNEGTEGMEWGKEWQGLGMRGNSSRPLKLNGVRIGAGQVLGAPGDQLWYVFNVVAPYFLTAMAGTYLGIAARAVAEAKAHLQKRTYTHNGLNLAQVPLLQHRLGTIWARVESTRQLIYNAALQGDKGDPAAVLSILAAKAAVAGCATHAVNEAMTLVGGSGYEGNATLGMLLRDARAADVMAPTTDLLYTWIGRALLDQPILSD